MDFSLPEEHFQHQIQLIIEEVLNDNQTALVIQDFSMKEGEGTLSTVYCTLLVDGHSTPVAAEGKGIVDALFTALAHYFHHTYLCLNTVTFEDFGLKAHFKDSYTSYRADAPVEITLALRTAINTRLYFRATSRSLVAAVIEAVRKSIEFLINCEKAVTELYLHIEELRQQGRYLSLIHI